MASISGLRAVRSARPHPPPHHAVVVPGAPLRPTQHPAHALHMRRTHSFVQLAASKRDAAKDAHANGTAEEHEDLPRSSYIGVCWERGKDKWRVRAYVDGKSIHIGRFDDEHLAAQVYDANALDLKGDGAKLNFPDDVKGSVAAAKAANALLSGKERKPRPPRSSQFKGVYYDTHKKRWIVMMNVDGKNKNVGAYDDEVFAAQVYDGSALELRGDKAKLNFPDDKEGSIAALAEARATPPRRRKSVPKKPPA